MATSIPLVEYSFESGVADGAVRWRVRTMHLREGLDTPFEAELRVMTDADLAISDLVGAQAVLTVARGEATRTFHGDITRAEVRAGSEGTMALVRFDSPLLRLDRGARFAIFQGKSALEILTEVLNRVGAVGPGSEHTGLRVDVSAAGETATREYCVHYGETDLEFVRHLLEDEGLAWLVEEPEGRPTFRVVDGADGFKRSPEGRVAVRIIEERHDEAEQESVQSIAMSGQRLADRVIAREWTWSDTAAVSEMTAPGSEGVAGGHHEVVTQASSHGRATDLARIARRSLQRFDARRILGRGRSNITALTAGQHLEITAPSGQILEVLVLEVTHTADCPEHDAAVTGAGANYANSFECQAIEAPYRPQRTVVRPRIHSLQSAVVVGPPGEEIHTDAHGRIKVRMHWDRSGGPDQDASCWLRVAQSWAGHGWGSMVIPRVGMEVLVAFLDGDPDRPVCVGCLFNGAHQPPYTLPAEKTKSTLRTQSTPDAAGYNELTFDDAAGAERVYVRAQRDLDAEVLRNLGTKISGQETRSVGGSRHTEVDRDDVVRVRQDEIRRTDGAQEIQVGGSVALQVGGGPALGDAAAAAPGMKIEIIAGGYSLSAPQRIELRCGASTIVMTPTSIDIAAPVSATLRCGGASLALSPAALGMLAPVLSIAAPGASLGLGNSASLSSAGGVKVGSSEDCELTLNGSATLTGSQVSIEGVSSFTATASRAEVTGFEEAVMSSEKTVRIADGMGTVVLEGGVVRVND